MTEPVVNTYAITVEKVPGFAKTRETFTIQSTNDDEAWNEARESWRRFGSMSIVVDVKLVPTPAR